MILTVLIVSVIAVASIIATLLILRSLRSVKARAVSLEKDIEAEQHQRYILATILAHDIRTPLNYISFAAQRLCDQQKAPDPEDIRETASAISQSSKKIAGFTENFMNWLQSQQSCYNYQPKPVDLEKLLLELETFFNELKHMGNNAIHFQLAEDVKTGLQSDYIFLRIILRNLLDNAIKYTSNGVVNVRAFRKQSEICIEVSDNGRGIPEAEIVRVQQLMQANAQHVKLDHSHKLGMQIVCGFMKYLDGRLEVERLTQGSAFRIYLPARDQV